MDTMKKLYSMYEVSQIFGVSRQTVWNWYDRGQLPVVVLPSGRLRIAREEIERILGHELKQEKSE